MKLFHTSPVIIEKIQKHGLFADCLFFSSEIYTMSAKGDSFIYSIDLDDSEVVEVNELYSEEVISDIMNALDVDEDAAENLLDGTDTAYDYDLDGEDDWYIQAKQGECAKSMGYKACKAEDEQGTVYIVPMLDSEDSLSLCD